jgi:DNA-binding response OmpR family regulator
MSSKSILIVDDDRNLRQSMALILRRANYRVDTAGTATDALSDLKNGQYDLTILDMMMPDDGSILLPKLLSLYPSLAILILSAQISAETSLETKHLGEHSRLVKPVTPETLLERVKAILDKPACAGGGHATNITGRWYG